MRREFGIAIAVGLATAAWVRYSEHPTALRLRKAVIATVQALLA